LVSIRLQRHGRKSRPYYHIVAADQRAPRDGRIIERIGSYSPTALPVVREVDAERAIYWLNNGAKPSDTVRSILKKEGVLYRHHLTNWGKSPEEIEAALEEWRNGNTSESEKTAKEVKKEQLRKEEENYLAAKAEADKAAAEAAAAEAAEMAKAAEAEVEAQEAAEATETAETEVEASTEETAAPADEASSEEEKA
jgi:small subunit ribosomal protein S16